MASDITSAATFTIANMKPTPGEQADAIWAQKAVDNTGYLYYRPVPGPSFFMSAIDSAAGGNVRGTFFFRKEPGMSWLDGTIVGTKVAVNADVDVWVSGVNVFTRNFTGAGTLFKHSFHTSISALTNGSYYEVQHSWVAGVNAGASHMGVTTWQAP